MLPITTDLLLDALCLAAFSNTDESRYILNKLTDMYDAAKDSKKNQMAVDSDMNIIITIIKDLSKTGILDKKQEVNKIVLKIKDSPYAKKDALFVKSVATLLDEGAKQGLSTRRELEIRKRLQNWCLISASINTFRDGLAWCNRYNQKNETENDLIIERVLDKAHDLTQAQNNVIGLAESIDELDFTSKSSMLNSADKYAKRKKTNIIRLGWQGLNRMMGVNGGVCRGELVGLAAPSYNGKSYMLMNIATWATVYNKYDLNDPSKIPTIVLVSLENEVSDNYHDMVKAAYVNKNHKPVPPDLSMEELIDETYDYFNQSGNRLIVKRFGEDFTYTDLVKLISRLEMKNMEIVCLLIDYPALMKIEVNDKDNAPKALEKLYQKLMDLAHARDIALFAGLQLDKTAEQLVSAGEVCAVKKLTGAALADAKGIRRALDILIFQMIEHIDNIDYITFSWNKHRNNAPPPPKDKFCAYRFQGDDIGIIDDIGSKDLSIQDIYADAAAITQPKTEEKEEDFFSGIKQV